ncbi:hypothetical protein HMPREF9946_03463 [Acetobacteraceae bacterium AT-5844]|nr:hypothetical protein HMPREF9946_03463 [Acetobacteraceae bacterium AT-5844]
MTNPSLLPVLRRREWLALAGLGMAAPGLLRSAQAQTASLRVDIAPHLYEIVHSPKQNALFVASAGGFAPGAPPPRVFRLDPTTLAVQAEIALPVWGFGLALDEEAGRLYVGHAVHASISIIDVASNAVLTTIQLAEMVEQPDGKKAPPYGLRRLVLDASRGRLYLPGLGMKDGVLYVVDTRRAALDRTVTGIGPAAMGIALPPSGDRIFISTLAGKLVTVDAEKLEVVRETEAGGAEQPLKLDWDPTNNRLLAVDQGLEGIRRMQQRASPGFVSRNPGNRVVALEPETGRLLAEAPVPAGPVTLLADPKRGALYVACRGGGTLTTLALDSLAKRSELPLPVHPNSFALDDAGNTLFVTVKAEGRDGAWDPEAVARFSL